MADFAQFKPAEMQLSDVASVQAPVQGSSSASAIGSIAQGVASLGQLGITAFQLSEQQEQKELELQKQQAFEAQKEEFSQELMSARDIAEQHGSTSLGFKTFLSMAYRQSNLDPDTKAKMMKDFQATVLGKAFTEKSVEEKVNEANQVEAGQAGWFGPDDSKPVIEAKTALFMKHKREQEAIAESTKAAQAISANLSATNAQREEAKFQLRENQKKFIVNLSSSGRHTQRQIISDTLAKLDSGASITDVQLELKSKLSDLKAMVSSGTKDIKDREFIDRLAEPLYELYDIALLGTDSATLEADLDHQINIIKKTEELALLQDEKLAEAFAFNSLAKNSVGAQIVIEGAAANYLVKNSREGSKGVDLVGETDQEHKENTNYLEVVLKSIVDRDKLDYKGELKIKPEQLQIQVQNILKGGGRSIGENDSAKSLQPIITFLADPQVGQYMNDPANKKLYTIEANSGLKSALENNAVNVVYPQVQDMLSDVLVVSTPTKVSKSGRSTIKTGGETDRPAPRRGQGGKVIPSSLARAEDLEISVVGGEVRFTSASREALGAAQRLNEKVAYTMSLYMKAMANSTGASLEQVLEDQRAKIWPEKYSTEEVVDTNEE